MKYEDSNNITELKDIQVTKEDLERVWDRVVSQVLYDEIYSNQIIKNEQVVTKPKWYSRLQFNSNKSDDDKCKIIHMGVFGEKDSGKSTNKRFRFRNIAACLIMSLIFSIAINSFSAQANQFGAYKAFIDVKNNICGFLGIGDKLDINDDIISSEKVSLDTLRKMDKDIELPTYIMDGFKINNVSFEKYRTGTFIYTIKYKNDVGEKYYINIKKMLRNPNVAFNYGDNPKIKKIEGTKYETLIINNNGTKVVNAISRSDNYLYDLMGEFTQQEIINIINSIQ